MSVLRSVLLWVCLFLGSTAVHACSCVPMMGSQRYAQFPTVFVGRVVATALVSNPESGGVLGREVVRATVIPTQIFKGTSAPSYAVIGDSEYLSAQCSLPLLAGLEYLFTLDQSAVATTCNAWVVDSPESQELLRTFRRLKAQKK